jgi:hypothetical protein
MNGQRYSLIHALQKDYKVDIPQETVESIRAKFKNNYFGLPPYAMQQSAGGLVYQCRKPMPREALDSSDHHSLPSQGGERPDSNKKSIEISIEKMDETNYTAQRKVASALLAMVSNAVMVKHFLYKGGFEAVMKLIAESKDREVLQSCGACLVEVYKKYYYYYVCYFNFSIYFIFTTTTIIIIIIIIAVIIDYLSIQLYS